MDVLTVFMDNSSALVMTGSGKEDCYDDCVGGFAAFTSFLLQGILSAAATVPYLIYVVFTFRYKALLQPKNVFKSNFAFSAILHLLATAVHAFTQWRRYENPHEVDINQWNRTCNLLSNSENEITALPSNKAATSCPEMIPLWWSAAGTIISTFLIEYDRFLAIRYPLLYPEMVTDERSIFACIASQICCLCLVLSLRHFSPKAFDCEQMIGDEIVQRAEFFKWIIIPYFICFVLSLTCSLYVAKIAIQQAKRAQQIRPINLPTVDESTTSNQNLPSVQQEQTSNGEAKRSVHCSVSKREPPPSVVRGFSDVQLINKGDKWRPFRTHRAKSKSIPRIHPSSQEQETKVSRSLKKKRKKKKAKERRKEESSSHPNISFFPSNNNDGDKFPNRNSSQMVSRLSFKRQGNKGVLQDLFRSSQVSTLYNNVRQRTSNNSSIKAHDTRSPVCKAKSLTGVAHVKAAEKIAFKCRHLRRISKFKRTSRSNISCLPSGHVYKLPRGGDILCTNPTLKIASRVGRELKEERQERSVSSARNGNILDDDIKFMSRSKLLHPPKSADYNDDFAGNESRKNSFVSFASDSYYPQYYGSDSNAKTSSASLHSMQGISQASIDKLTTKYPLKQYQTEPPVYFETFPQNPNPSWKTVVSQNCNKAKKLSIPTNMHSSYNKVLVEFTTEKVNKIRPVSVPYTSSELLYITRHRQNATRKFSEVTNTHRTLDPSETLFVRQSTINVLSSMQEKCPFTITGEPTVVHVKEVCNVNEVTINVSDNPLINKNLVNGKHLNAGPHSNSSDENITVIEMVMGHANNGNDALTATTQVKTTNLASADKSITNNETKEVKVQRNQSLQATVEKSAASTTGGRTGSSAVVTQYEELKNDIKSTIKTLSLILMYLAISLPTYVTATVHRECFCTEYGRQSCCHLHKYLYVFGIFSLIGHIGFPCTWFFFDKMYGDKLLKTLRIIRDAHWC